MTVADQYHLEITLHSCLLACREVQGACVLLKVAGSAAAGAPSAAALAATANPLPPGGVPGVDAALVAAKAAKAVEIASKWVQGRRMAVQTAAAYEKQATYVAQLTCWSTPVCVAPHVQAAACM
jgi:hypothetical protein